jgi:hypothetical protein
VLYIGLYMLVNITCIKTNDLGSDQVGLNYMYFQ